MNETVYYWFDPDTGAALYHTGVYEDEADPFFESVEDAEVYLEHRANHHDRDRYEGMSLYRARVSKVEDAIEVLLDQSGLDEFSRYVSDGHSDR